MADEKCKKVKKGKIIKGRYKQLKKAEKIRGSVYRQILKDEIMKYALLHGEAECTPTKMLTVITAEPHVQTAYGKRGYKTKKDAYGSKPNIERYREVFTDILESLVVDNLLKKDDTIKNQPKYTLVAPKPYADNLRNTDIVILQVEKGREKDVKSIIETNIVDKNIITISLDGFLMCTVWNPLMHKGLYQALYIQEQVESALQKADCTVYVRVAEEDGYTVEKAEQDNLRKILGENYSYYWYDQQVTCDSGKHQERRFLILECAPEVTDIVYTVIADKHSHLFDSLYRGFGGVVLSFNVTTKKSKKLFDNFISLIKKDPVKKRR